MLKKISKIKELDKQNQQGNNRNRKEWLVKEFRRLDNSFLDFIMIEGKKLLDAIETGERKELHYFEKSISEIIEIIYQVKEEKLFKVNI